MGNPTWSDVMKFELVEKPILFDVGGYKGDWTQLAIDKYGLESIIYVFEPVKKFYEILVERYKHNQNVKIFNFGLSDKNRVEKISSGDDASSVFIGECIEEVNLVDIIEFLFDHKIFHVDLIKINIEGEEYRLLEHLINHPELNVFQNFLIQFHTFIDNYADRHNLIINEISKFYDNLFDYKFVFEGWTMKSLQKTNCLGDSHVSVFSNSPTLIQENMFHTYKTFNSYRFGPYLAYNLLDKGNVLNLLASLPKNENILLCFGEIDCRAQVKNHLESNANDFKIVIDKIISRYFQAFENIDNKNIILFSVTPDLKENPYKEYYDVHADVFDCPRGTYHERREYKEYFNCRVKEKSESLGYNFLSIYDYIVSEKETKEIYYLDQIHLKSSNVLYLIKREFIKSGLIV